jgi:hypothetical protein
MKIERSRNDLELKKSETSPRQGMSFKGPSIDATAIYIAPKIDPDEPPVLMPILEHTSFKRVIKKKNKHITFRDTVTGKSIADVKEVESYKQYNKSCIGASSNFFCIAF